MNSRRLGDRQAARVRLTFACFEALTDAKRHSSGTGALGALGTVNVQGACEPTLGPPRLGLGSALALP